MLPILLMFWLHAIRAATAARKTATSVFSLAISDELNQARGALLS